MAASHGPWLTSAACSECDRAVEKNPTSLRPLFDGSSDVGSPVGTDSRLPSDVDGSFELLASTAALIGCDLRKLPRERYRLSRSGIGRTFATRAELVAFLRAVEPA